MESNTGAYSLALYNVNRQKPNQSSKQMLMRTHTLSY